MKIFPAPQEPAPPSVRPHSCGPGGRTPRIRAVGGLCRGFGKLPELHPLPVPSPFPQVAGTPVPNAAFGMEGFPGHGVNVGSGFRIPSQPAVDGHGEGDVVPEFKARQVSIAEIPVRLSVHRHQVQVAAQLGRTAEPGQGQENKGYGAAEFSITQPVSMAGHVAEEKVQEAGSHQQIDAGRDAVGREAEIFYLEIQPHAHAGGEQSRLRRQDEAQDDSRF